MVDFLGDSHGETVNFLELALDSGKVLCCMYTTECLDQQYELYAEVLIRADTNLKAVNTILERRNTVFNRLLVAVREESRKNDVLLVDFVQSIRNGCKASISTNQRLAFAE